MSSRFCRGDDFHEPFDLYILWDNIRHWCCRRGAWQGVGLSLYRVGIPPWRQPRGKLVVSLVDSCTNATRIGWHLWELDLRFPLGLPPEWTAHPACHFEESRSAQVTQSEVLFNNTFPLLQGELKLFLSAGDGALHARLLEGLQGYLAHKKQRPPRTLQ